MIALPWLKELTMAVIKYLRETYGLANDDILVIMGALAGQLINFKSQQVDALIQGIMENLGITGG